jgi:predicted TIM-barrel fold metal-dependent hydrolase
VGSGWVDNSAELIGKIKNDGYIGVKFWFGPPYRRYSEGEEQVIKLINDSKLASYFSNLEKEKTLMASVHVNDPNGPYDNRQIWLEDPILYWQHVRAFEDFVAKYPNLPIVAAHGAWIFCQDAQLDYLRYMFATYPNLYVDISATFQYWSLVNYDNLRDIFIEFQDRFLFGSDFGGRIENKAEAFAANFALLETDQRVHGDLTGAARNNGLVPKGLNLPREVLEKIYYKNAVKLYPGLKELMGL